MMIIRILCLFSVSLKTLCVWNLAVKLGTDFVRGHLSFILRAASDTLPTSVNLQQWHIHYDVKCSLCSNTCPTTAHVLEGCPVALSQGHFTYKHDQVLHCIVSNLSGLLASHKPFMFMLTYQECMLVCLLRQSFLHHLS